MPKNAPVATPVTVREVERKFRVHGLWTLPDLTTADAVAEVRERDALTQVATYFDSGDLRLAREGITLRRRSGGVDDGWHLKLPVQGMRDARDEVRLPLGEADAPVPAELRELVTAFLRNAALTPVTALRTRRLPRELLDPEGLVLAELVDDSVEVLDGERVALRFREIELENGEAGSPAAMRAVMDALVDSGAVPGQFTSKAVRALGPLASAAPDVEPAPPVSAHDPAAAAVRAHLATHVRALRAADVGVRRGETDAVHQMRVSARRLRSGLRAFRPLLDREWTDALRDELQWIANELGGARDREVLELRLKTALDALPQDVESLAARTLVTKHLDREIALARTHALDSMRSGRYLSLLDALVDAVHAPQTTQAALRPAGQVLAPLLAKAWKRLAYDAAALTLDGHDDAWHEARKAAKQVRYVAEAVTPVLGKEAKKLAKQVERVTELLGEHQDASIAAATLAQLGGAPRVSARAAFTLGVLHAQQRQAVHDTRVAFPGVWAEVSSAEHRAFLRGAH